VSTKPGQNHLTHSSHKGQKKAPPLAGDGSRAGLLPGKVVESERQDARDYMVNEKWLMKSYGGQKKAPPQIRGYGGAAPLWIG
jgi:hypothetical protein